MEELVSYFRQRVLEKLAELVKFRERADTFVWRPRKKKKGVKLLVGVDKKGRPVFPGGGIDAGETFEEGTSREIKEEAGRRVERVKRLEDTEDFINTYKRKEKVKRGAEASRTGYATARAPKKITHPEVHGSAGDAIPRLRWRTPGKVRKLLAKSTTKRSKSQAKALEAALAAIASDRSGGFKGKVIKAVLTKGKL
jgi:ADP-ribose pyrophosphatase YjhB (NUDIX family)